MPERDTLASPHLLCSVFHAEDSQEHSLEGDRCSSARLALFPGVI